MIWIPIILKNAVFLPWDFLFLWKFMALNLFFIIPSYYITDLDFSISLSFFHQEKKSYLADLAKTLPE